MYAREITFLRLLLENEKYLPVSFYARQMQVSDKTLRRMVPGLNSLLAAYGGLIASCPGNGIRLDIMEAQREQLFNYVSMPALVESDPLSKTWNQLARRIDIVLNLLLYSDETTSLAEMSYKYYVSKSSIAIDLKALKAFAQKYGLNILQSRQGTRIDGKESNLREAISDLLLYILDTNISAKAKSQSQGNELFDADTRMTILDIFTEDDLNFVEGLLKYIEADTGYRFDEREYMALSLRFLVLIYRYRNGFLIEPGLMHVHQELEKDYIGIFSLSLASRLDFHYNCTLPILEISYIYHILSATRLSNFLIHRELPEEESRKTAVAFGEDFIDAFSAITGINLRSKPAFYANVMTHIKLMLGRAASNTPARNPIIDILLENYKGTINVCQIICQILVEKFSLPNISFDEICYLMLYIQGELLAEEENLAVILVSNMSNSITNILKYKLSQNYPRWSVNSCDYNCFLDLRQKQYDLLLSTVPINSKECQIPYVLISPLLEEKNCAGIDHVLKSIRHKKELYTKELKMIKSDLSDIGCSVEIRRGEAGELLTSDFLKIEALKGVEFVYLHNRLNMNQCEFVVDISRKVLTRVIINMSNWDFMLFASKMVYLMDNCPDWALTEFIQYIITEER